MPAFLSESLEQLTRQLTFAPPSRRRSQMDQAESLYWQIEPQRNYPLDFVIFRITSYRPDSSHGTTLVGAAIRRDLLNMVDQLSASMDERIADYDPRPIDEPTLSKQLNVSAKTLSRYRRMGLFARRLIWPDGKRRVSYLPASVDRFLTSQPTRIQQAAQFNRINDDTRHRIIMRARRIAGRVPTTPFAVAEHLSKKFSRSTEAIRRLLLAHDRHDPRVAIFPDHTPPLTERQQRVIQRAYHRGVAVSKMARHFNRSRTAIYRAINQRRAAAIRNLNIRFVPSPVFDRRDAADVILHSDLPDASPILPEPTRDADALKDMPLLPALTDEQPLSAPDELSLFVRYNYLKFRVMTLRDQLDAREPHAGILDQIETYMRRATTIRHRLVRTNMRLIVSVARKHKATARRAGRLNLADLVSEGSVVLLEAIDTFDASRGNQFSTYLTWALMRRFAQWTSKQTAAQVAKHGAAASNPPLASFDQAEHAIRTLTYLLDRLDERERFIVMRHFGLGDVEGDTPRAQTLSQVARQLNISAERARKIEHRALRKLREAAAAAGLSLGGGDLLSPS